ncbi:hypothetical protein [Streptomyces sp. NPDC052127]|uniref:hypothetical protein n=1 Tax=Streptomyces sp. NPDC052127 TaxID=3155679 RepID=UPI00342996DC
MGRLTNRTPISTKPGGPHADPTHATDYSASRGGHYPAKDKPTTGGDSTADGRNSGLGGSR